MIARITTGLSAAKTLDVGEKALEFGTEHEDTRAQVLAHICIGDGYSLTGDYTEAIESYRRALGVAQDRLYSQYPKAGFSWNCINAGRIDEAETATREYYEYGLEFSLDSIRPIGEALTAFIIANRGQLRKGVSMLKSALRRVEPNYGPMFQAIFEIGFGRMYMAITRRSNKVNRKILLKNLGFLVVNFPFVHRIAMRHIVKARAIAEKIGARNLLALAEYDIGLLYSRKNKGSNAKMHFERAIALFEEMGATIHLENARRAIAEIGGM